MSCAILRICLIGALLTGSAGCQGLRGGLPDDPLFIGRTPATGNPTSEPPPAWVYSEPAPPPAPLDMQDRPSLARDIRPVPTPQLRPPAAPDITRTPHKTPAILTNRPR